MNFETATKLVGSGKFSATNEDKLQLYALYKIAMNEVPCNGIDPRRYAMHARWKLLVETMDVEASRRAYVRVVAKLIGVPELSKNQIQEQE